jgi:hypothetical protein
VRNRIVEGDDFSVLPAPVVVLLRRITRLLRRSSVPRRPEPTGVDRESFLRRLYEAHARRDIDSALAGLTDDVAWPNVAAGTVLHGHEQVREYWMEQFKAIDPRVEPVTFEEDGDTMAVTVHQVVRDLEGAVLSDSMVMHTYTFRGDLIAAMVVTPSSS